MSEFRGPYSEAQATAVRAAIDKAMGTTSSAKPRRKHVTPAKAQRLVDAIAALQECDDLDPSCDVPLNDARAAIEQHL